jgi:hypothetical protein
MNITSQPAQEQTLSFAAAAMNTLTFGYAEKLRPSILGEEPPSQLEDMRLSEMYRDLFEREFRKQLGGSVENRAVDSEFGPLLQIQYTVAYAPKFEIVFLQIPRSILEDGKKIPQLLQLVYVLRGKTVRVVSPDLTGPPSPSFNGLKRIWEGEEEGRRIKIDYVPLPYIEALEQGKADLANVLNLDLRGAVGSQAPASDLGQPHTPTEAEESRPTMAPKRVEIFLASSKELQKDREDFELYLRQLNDQLSRQDLYLKIVGWENFLDAMSQTRLQDEYNEAVRTSNIFVSLFFTKTGKFTEEEFDVAHRQFQETGKPLIYTFFKAAPVNTDQLDDEVVSLLQFKKKLTKLGHFNTGYNNIEDLKLKFRNQLDKLLEQGKLSI